MRKPKLPLTLKGNVDKRTTQYKHYMAQLGESAIEEVPPPSFGGIGITGQRYELLGEPGEKTQSVLEEAQMLIHGDREKEYGHPAKNLRAIANMWEMYLHEKYDAQLPLDAADVAWMMTLLKMCRDFNGAKRDTITDAAGYIGLIGRVRYG